MISIKTVPAPITPRKVYHFDNEEERLKYTNFKVGSRVLPAEYFNNETVGVEFYYISTHTPYEIGHIGTGGITTQCSDGSIRTFYPDSVIISPNSFEMRKETTQFDMNGEGIKKRGRKGDPQKAAKREEAKRIRQEKLERGEVLKRGRPTVDPSLRKTKPYVPNGGQRGRKKLSDEEKQQREKQQNNTPPKEPGKRGRKEIPGLKESKLANQEKINQAKITLGIITGRGRISDFDQKRLKQYLKNN